MGTYVETETNDPANIAVICPECGSRIQKRRDSYLPGMHQVICVLCGHTDSAVDLTDGNHAEQSPEDSRAPDDFQGR